MSDGEFVIERSSIGALIEVLKRRGFTVIGPRLESRASLYGELGSDAGWTDAQGGTYRVSRRDDDALFAHNAGPSSWKSLLFPPTVRVWKGRRSGSGGLEARRRDALIVDVNCGTAGGTCFCVSMGTGPAVPAEPGETEFERAAYVAGMRAANPGAYAR